MKIVAFGEVMMRLMSTDKKTISQNNRLDYLFTGTGVNILGALRKMGNDVSLITKVTDDSLGEGALTTIRSLGIETKFISQGKGALGLYFLEEGYGLRPSKVTYMNRKESVFSKSKLSDYNLKKALEGKDAIHICGISLALSKGVRESVDYILKYAKEKNIKIIFDCNYRPSLWEGKEDPRKEYRKILEYTDILFATEQDAINLFGITTEEKNSKKRTEETLKVLAKKYNIVLIAGTIRESSSVDDKKIMGFVVEKGEIVFSKQYKLHILDRIGGGDGYAAGIIHAYLEKRPIREVVEFGIVSGVLAHTTYGDTPISSVKDIEEVMKGKVCELKR